jgi:hypothetical protein
MFWEYRKLDENTDKVIYSYQCLTEKGIGKLEYDKNKKDDVIVLEVASDGTMAGAKWAAGHLWSKIHHEGIQDEFRVAIG